MPKAVKDQKSIERYSQTKSAGGNALTVAGLGMLHLQRECMGRVVPA